MKKQISLSFLSFVFLLLAATTSFAGFGYEGYLTDASGHELISQAVVLKLEIKNPDNTCLLYREIQNVTTGSDGYFSVIVGTGTRQDSNTGYSLSQLFENRASSFSLSGCTYTPVAGDSRNMAISVSGDAGASFDSLGSIAISPAPNASSADNVAGIAPTSLLRVSTGSATPLTSANFTDLQSLIAGTSTKYMTTAPGAVTSLPAFSSAPSSPTEGNIWYDTTTHAIKYRDNSGTITLGPAGAAGVGSITAGTGITVGGTASVPVISLSGSYVTSVGVSAPLSVTNPTTAPSVSIAAASGGTDGYLSATDWNTFNNKISAVTVGNLPLVPVSKGGTGATSFPANQMLAADATGSAIVGFSCSPGSLASFDGSGWIQCASSISEGQISWSSQPANKIFAGPPSSSPATPSFRFLSLNDLPAGVVFSGGNSGGSPLAIGTNDANRLDFKSNNVVNLTLDTNGNLGLGTTTPSAMISLNGQSNRSIAMERNTTANNAGNSLSIAAGGGNFGGSNTNGGDLILKSGVATGSGSSNIQFQTASAGSPGTADRTPSTVMTILGNGNVGIGNTNPQSQLTVSGSAELDGPLYLSSSLMPFATTTGSSNAYYLTTYPAWGGALVDGTLVRFKPHIANTATSTLSVNGGTPYTMYLSDGTTTLPSGFLAANTEYTAIYRSGTTAWIVNPVNTSAPSVNGVSISGVSSLTGGTVTDSAQIAMTGVTGQDVIACSPNGPAAPANIVWSAYSSGGGYIKIRIFCLTSTCNASSTTWSCKVIK